MTELVTGLPGRTVADRAKLFVIDTKAVPVDGNAALKNDVAIATGKNWTVYDWNDGSEVEYAGQRPVGPRPTIDPNGGTFTDSVEVTITGSGGTVYYTTDETDPTTSGTRTEYTAPFTLTQTSTVRAAVQNGSLWSGITSSVFTVHPPGHHLRTEQRRGRADRPVNRGRVC